MDDTICHMRQIGRRNQNANEDYHTLVNPVKHAVNAISYQAIRSESWNLLTSLTQWLWCTVFSVHKLKLANTSYIQLWYEVWNKEQGKLFPKDEKEERSITPTLVWTYVSKWSYFIAHRPVKVKFSWNLELGLHS